MGQAVISANRAHTLPDDLDVPSHRACILLVNKETDTFSKLPDASTGRYEVLREFFPGPWPPVSFKRLRSDCRLDAQRPYSEGKLQWKHEEREALPDPVVTHLLECPLARVVDFMYPPQSKGDAG